MKTVFYFHIKMANALLANPAKAFFVVFSAIIAITFLDVALADNDIAKSWLLFSGKLLMFLVALPVMVIVALKNYF